MIEFNLTWVNWNNLTQFYWEGEDITGPLIYYAYITLNQIQRTKIMNPSVIEHYNKIKELIDNHPNYLDENIPYFIKAYGFGKLLELETEESGEYAEYFRRLYFFISNIQNMELPQYIPLYLGQVNKGKYLFRRIYNNSSGSPHPILSMPILSCGISTSDINFYTASLSEEEKENLDIIETLLISSNRPLLNLKDIDYTNSNTGFEYFIRNQGENPFNITKKDSS